MVNDSRNLKRTLLEDLIYFPIVGILGPRQCGKTTLALEMVKEFPDSIYLDLESPSDLNKLQNPEYFLNQNRDRLICLDEIQRMPELFPVIRSVVDRNKRKTRILILGSASPDLLKQSSESLAGRIIFEYLTPFTLDEIYSSPESREQHWLKGGYPLSFLQETKVSYKWRESFVRTILERDIPELGFKTSSLLLHRFLMMLSHSAGQLLNKSKIAASLGVSHNTVSNYLDIFEKTFYARSLQPYSVNIKKRIVKAPKTYIRDTGILHMLLGIHDLNELLGNPNTGASWESYCIENIITSYPEYSPYFYRTSNGHEIDLILDNGNKKIAVECKFSASPKASAHFLETLEELNIDQAFIVCPINESYSVHPKVKITGLLEMMKENKSISENDS